MMGIGPPLPTYHNLNVQKRLQSLLQLKQLIKMVLMFLLTAQLVLPMELLALLALLVRMLQQKKRRRKRSSLKMRLTLRHSSSKNDASAPITSHGIRVKSSEEFFSITDLMKLRVSQSISLITRMEVAMMSINQLTSSVSSELKK